MRLSPAPALVGLLALAGPAVSLHAAEISGALIVLEVAPGTPGSEPAGAPPRFVLLKDGQVFVGGTARIEVGRLERGELAALRKRAELARKAVGRNDQISLGGDRKKAFRLRLPGDRPVPLLISGDPAQAPPALAPVASLINELVDFYHPSLVPFVPASYSLTAREGQLVGGCRPWTFAVSIRRALESPQTVSAAEASGWPTGALPASVCADDRRYVVTLRPLLPGEQP